MFGQLANVFKDKMMDQVTTEIANRMGGGGGGPVEDERKPTEFMTSNCTGNKKAVFIGINYKGQQSELRGCINDVNNISKFLFENYGFSPENSKILTEEQSDPSLIPTKANMIAAMQWLVQDAKKDDSLVFHYSGHGATQKDTDGDEADGFDETLIPLDFQKAGMLVDDEIHQILVHSLPEGVRLTAIMDCCHSGTALDLPFIYNVKGNIELTVAKNHLKEGLTMLVTAGMAYQQGKSMDAVKNLANGVQLLIKKPQEVNKEAQAKAEKERKSMADVVSFSGCRDDQTSADAKIAGAYTGAMSHALVTVLTNRKGQELTYLDLLMDMREILNGKYSQIPQMSSGRLVDMHAKFLL